MSEVNKENIGGLIISEDVIAEIAKNATKDIEGVAGFSARPVDIKGMFKKGGNSSKAVKVLNRDNEMVLDLYICLKSGVKIPVVCENVQRSVKEAVQNMTGQIVSKVNVNVADIAFPSEEHQQQQA